MLIQIESGTKASPRTVTIVPDDGEPFSFKADNLADVHKKLNAALKDGWDTLRPAKK